jgi:hypothetical protein
MRNDLVVDLTRVSVDFRLEFDTLDAVLLITTGGVGYLARAAYRHFDGKEARDRELQRENCQRLIEEAQHKGASKLTVRVSPGVPIYAPAGGNATYTARTSNYDEIELSFS